MTLPERILLISDLHLDEQRPDITAAFKLFLMSNQNKCTSLYILGDLFEVWIGDDVKTALSEEIANALKAFSEGGSNIYLMHGNRDFLIGNTYAEQCGGTLIQEPFKLITNELTAVLLHGDTLCTDDIDYQEFRATVRAIDWQTDFLSKTVDQRLAYAQEARHRSQLATEKKRQEIMDVNKTAVNKLFSDTQQSTIIHGHTHRPAIHNINLDCSQSTAIGRRVVLGDWDKAIWFAEIQQNRLELYSRPLAS